MADAHMTLAFGAMGKARPDRAELKRDRFRMAIFGDFSGRAARGEIETGEALAKRRRDPAGHRHRRGRHRRSSSAR